MKGMLQSAIKQGAQDVFIEDASARYSTALIDAAASLQTIALQLSSDKANELQFLTNLLKEERAPATTIYIGTNSIPETENKPLINPDPALSLMKAVSGASQIRALGIRGDSFTNAGATAVQELAFTLSYLVGYWDNLSDRGVSIEELIHHTEVALGVGDDFYTDLAKFRAMRTLLHYILDAYQIKNPNPYLIPLRAISSTINKTLYDPDGNILRNTTEALAATLGGAQYLTLRPHDLQFKPASVFGQRMALNIQHLLQDESHVHRVHNPAEGSFFLENITQQLIEKSWQLFLEIEADGGLVPWQASGKLNSKLAENKALTQKLVAEQKKVLIGINRYINPDQIIDQEAVAHKPSYRAEQLRLKIDQLPVRQKPAFTLVKPLVIHNISQVSLRITFVTDALNSLGIPVNDVVDSTGLVINSSSSSTIIFCADDHWYQENLERELIKKSTTEKTMIAVGQSPLLERLSAEGVLTFLLHPQADLSDLYNLVESML